MCVTGNDECDAMDCKGCHAIMNFQNVKIVNPDKIEKCSKKSIETAS